MEKLDSHINSFRIATSYKKDILKMAKEDKRKEFEFVRILIEKAVDEWRVKNPTK